MPIVSAQKGTAMDWTSKKMTFITGSLTDGGAERVMSILANQCAEMGAKVSIVIMREREQSFALSDKVNCYQIKVKNDKFVTVRRIMKLHKILKEQDVGTLIPFLPIISLYTLMANIGIGRKIIMSERADPNVSIFANNFSVKDRIGNLLMRKMGLFVLADYMVFQTSDAQSWYSKRIQRKSCIIPNPLDLSHLPKRFRGERRKSIVAAGRFSEEKNFPMLLRAFSAFHVQFPEYILELYGEGSLRQTLESMCKEFGIVDSVKMDGFVNDLPTRIVDASMYISTSNHEGISNSMLEALGMGIPTIVTDCPVGGARMFVETDYNGIIIPMEDVDALVCAMSKIASNKKYALEISVNAEKIRYKLDANNIAKKWLDLV